MFYKCMNSKRRAKENVYPLLDAVGNMTTEVKEKAEVLSTFFTFAFNCQTSYPWGTQPPDLEVWVGEQNKPPTIQVQTETFYPIGLSQVCGASWDSHEDAEEAGGHNCQCVVRHPSEVLVNQGGPRGGL